MLAGTTCTSSSSSKPHSRERMASMNFSPISDLTRHGRRQARTGGSGRMMCVTAGVAIWVSVSACGAVFQRPPLAAVTDHGECGDAHARAVQAWQGLVILEAVGCKSAGSGSSGGAATSPQHAQHARSPIAPCTPTRVRLAHRSGGHGACARQGRRGRSAVLTIPPHDLMVAQRAPQLVLVAPLIHADAAGAQAEHALPHAQAGGDAHQRLAGPTGQHNDT